MSGYPKTTDHGYSHTWNLTSRGTLKACHKKKEKKRSPWETSSPVSISAPTPTLQNESSTRFSDP